MASWQHPLLHPLSREAEMSSEHMSLPPSAVCRDDHCSSHNLASSSENQGSAGPRPGPDRCRGPTCHLHPRPRGFGCPLGQRASQVNPLGQDPGRLMPSYQKHLHFHLEPLKPRVHVTDGGVSGTEPADGVIVGDRSPFRLPDFKGQSCWVTRPLSRGCRLHGRQTCLPACPSCPD